MTTEASLRHFGLAHKLWRWAFWLCLLAVLVLALVPAPPAIITTGWDKTNHVLAFAVSALLGCVAFARRTLWVLVGLLAFGGLIEVLQSFTPTRTADWGDLLADAVGLALGCLLHHVLSSSTSAARRATRPGSTLPPP
jgi:VanZ family protein